MTVEKIMDLNNHLIELSDRLDKEGKTTCANAVDNLIKSGSLIKISQYVGVIGYVLKQNRAMCNCIRRKRATNDGSMQDVILDCLKEYQDGQDYHDTKWTSKYAQCITDHPEEFDGYHIKFIREACANDQISDHINRLRKAASILREEEEDDEVINQVLSHIQTLGEMLQKEAANNRPFKVAADPDKSRWTRFWESPINPLSSWYKDWSRKNRMRGDDTAMDEDLNTITDKVMNISTLSDTMKDEVRYLRAQARYIPDEEMSHIIQSLNPDDWPQVQHDITRLEKALGQYDQFPNTRPINDAVRLAQQLRETRDVIKKEVADIRALLQNVARREAMQGRREHRAPGQAEAISIEFDMLRKIVRALGRNPLDERAHDYALRMISRLSDVLDPIDSPQNTPGDRFPVDTTEELNNFQFHKEVNDWMRPVPESLESPTGEMDTVSTAVSPQNVDPTKIQEITNHIKSKTGNPTEAANILQSIAIALMGAHVIDSASYDTLIQVVQQLRGVPGSAEPGTPTVESSPTKPSVVNPEVSAAEIEQALTKFKSTGNVVLKLADAIDEVDSELAAFIDKYIEEHGTIINLPEMPEFGAVLKEKEE